uniref:Myosin motor domain-containing protein n=1 Tax=Zonotrichia albicollis TaxID=44394 RepID=A0A8D2QAJ0_ZONAL
MFNLMKKDKEKDGARKEKKKEKKERMSAAELKSLEEMSMRRGFFNLNRASKRDSKTRLEISNPIPIKVASGSELHLTDIDSDSNRGSIILDSGHLSTASSSDDLKADDTNFKGSVLQRAAKFGSLAKQNSQVIVKRFSFSQKSRDESTSETSTPSEHSAAPSPQVEVRIELSRCWLRGGQGTRRAAWDLDPAASASAPSQVLYPRPQEPSASTSDPLPSSVCLWAGVCARASCWSAKTEEQIAAEEAWYETEKVWLVHRDGFSLAPARCSLVSASVLPACAPCFVTAPRTPQWLDTRHTGCHCHTGAFAVLLGAAAVQGSSSTRPASSGPLPTAQPLHCSASFPAVEKWQALYTILEAFGNSSTGMNGNATRFSQIISLDFDQAGQVASASVQTLLLEKLRVARHPANEATFNVFYYLLACSDSTLRTELHFNHLAENNVFGIVPPSKPEEKQKATQQFSKLLTAMKVMGISGDEQKAFWLILGAIYHLGAAGATKAGRKQFARHEWAQKAAYLLGCSLEELSSAIFKHQPKGTLQRSTSFRQGPDESPLGDSGPKLTALECLEGMAAGLYSELFTLLISLLNRALKSSQHSVCSVTVVDTPGAQNPKLAGQSRGATFEELCHNYAQERLQQLFHQRTFARELERYKEENIELALADAEPSSSGSIAAVDQSSHQVRSLARTDEARGLLWLLEEEALQPGGNEDTLLERLFSYYGPQEGGKEGHNPLLPSDKPRHFLLGHSSGTNWVEYDATGWLNYVKHNPASQNASSLLQESQKKVISSLFAGRGGSALVLSGSVAGLEGGSQLALRRATSMRKTFTTGVAAVKKKSLCIQIKLQVDALIDSIKKSKLHFVHCFLPKAGAGGDPQAVLCRRVSSSELELPAEHCEAGLMQLDVPLLRAQLRGSRLLDALRMYRQGYPDHMVFAEFRRRFDVLAPHLTKKHGRNYIVVDEKRAVEELLESLDLEKSSYHMGLSRVFFRAGSLARLEEQRDTQTSRNITLFQAACRGFLARQHFKKRKIQDLAIRCVQKNIKKNKGVKDWPWWKLFTTVRPLIEVQLTEDQIRGKDEEIQQLKSKLEKVEKERNELRLNSDRLESRITELTSELTDERNTGESASQLLDAETAERLRAEKEMKDLQVRYDALKKQMESMEMEVMEARLIRAAELNGELDDDDSGGEWRLKYERAVREIDFTKKRLQQELEDKLEVEQQGKRQLERKLADLQADSEESQRALQQLKKKCQRLAAELQDTKLHLEGQQGRNHDLEKKQRRFDSELSQAHEEAQRERLQREKLSREKDVLVAEVFGLKQLLEDRDSDIAGLTQKAEALEAELQDISSQESKDEASLAKVKKQLRDLEAKVKDQEEELDEQAGTIQMLEQVQGPWGIWGDPGARQSLATRLKENMEKLTEERDQRAAAENREKEQNKRLQRQLRDVKEEMGELAKKEAEASRKKHELEMDLESLEAANQSLQSDLKLAFKRIGDLQAAIEDEMESDSNEDLINSDGDSDVDSELEERVDGVKSWLSKNKGSSKTLSDDGSLKGSSWKSRSSPVQPLSRPANPWRWRSRTSTCRLMTLPRPRER